VLRNCILDPECELPPRFLFLSQPKRKIQCTTQDCSGRAAAGLRHSRAPANPNGIASSSPAVAEVRAGRAARLPWVSGFPSPPNHNVVTASGLARAATDWARKTVGYGASLRVRRFVTGHVQPARAERRALPSFGIPISLLNLGHCSGTPGVRTWSAELRFGAWPRRPQPRRFGDRRSVGVSNRAVAVQNRDEDRSGRTFDRSDHLPMRVKCPKLSCMVAKFRIKTAVLRGECPVRERE